MTNDRPYNPLDKTALGASVAEALLERPVHHLEKLRQFPGVGLYVLYYTGNFAAYQPIARQNRDNRFGWPIYVGKAGSQGGRKGKGSTDPQRSKQLHKRLTEHLESIKQAENLEVEDFHLRYLLVDELFVPLGERLLLAKYAPLWNQLIDGFGNHNPGAGRTQGRKPRWDVLHPGRPWARNTREREETANQITREIEQFLAQCTVPEPTGILGFRSYDLG